MFLGFARPIEKLQKGLTSFQAGYYDLAIKEFLKVKEIDKAQQAELNFKIAEAYRLTNRWIESIPFYEKAFDSGLNNNDAIFYYAYALKAKEEYTKAKIYLENLLTPNQRIKL